MCSKKSEPTALMNALERGIKAKHFHDDSSEEDHDHDHQNHDDCSDHLGSLENMDNDQENAVNPFDATPGTTSENGDHFEFQNLFGNRNALNMGTKDHIDDKK